MVFYPLAFVSKSTLPALRRFLSRRSSISSIAQSNKEPSKSISTIPRTSTQMMDLRYDRATWSINTGLIRQSSQWLISTLFPLSHSFAALSMLYQYRNSIVYFLASEREGGLELKAFERFKKVELRYSLMKEELKGRRQRRVNISRLIKKSKRSSQRKTGGKKKLWNLLENSPSFSSLIPWASSSDSHSSNLSLNSITCIRSSGSSKLSVSETVSTEWSSSCEERVSVVWDGVYFQQRSTWSLIEVDT